MSVHIGQALFTPLMLHSEGLLFIMSHRRDSVIFVMLRIPAGVTDSLRRFLLHPGIAGRGYVKKVQDYVLEHNSS